MTPTKPRRPPSYVLNVRTLRMIRLISKFMTSQPRKKQLQYSYCPISQEEKAIRD